MKISVVINTFNAQKHLREVLNSVKEFEEIVIVDMYSSDSTVEIAKEFNCKILYHEKTNIVEPARMFAINAASNEWVLVLDADELVPPALKDYLYNYASGKNANNGLMIPRKNYFMGRFLRAAYPDYLLRFFRKDKVEWPPYVHVKPIIEGKIDKIPKRNKKLAFIHLANDTIEANIKKTNLYTQKEIYRRKNRKYSIFAILGGTIYRFFKYYFLKGAIFDGKPGLIYAGLNTFYKFTTMAKITEYDHQYNDLQKDIEKITLEK